MKQEILQQTLKLIKSHIRQITKAKNKDWITPDDTRYTRIVNKYEKKLSKHWQKTRDTYVNKTTQKAVIEVDDNPEDYVDAQFDSSDYIDGALAILATAFGEAVVVGYKELLGRNLSVEIPENPHEIFNEAKEIKNYAWAALSYEQQQMDDVFEEYNKTKEGKKKIQEWFDNNEYRLTDLMLGGVVWYGANYGFARGVIETSSGEDSGLLIYWLTEKDGKVCDDCLDLEKGGPYSKDNPLPTLPGGGKTKCGSRCRCILDTKQR